MKNLSTYLLAAAVGLSVLSSCKKDSTTPSKTDLLTSKSWKIAGDVTVQTTNGKSTTTDNFATASACEKDNFIKFGTDKKAVFDEGANKCQGANQTETGVWDFNSDQTKLTLGAPGTSMVGQFDVVELTASSLKLSQSDTSNGTTEVETITFTAF
ncbi:hypothetical protein GCM10028822_38620 [Hymenobacter terrigena]